MVWGDVSQTSEVDAHVVAVHRSSDHSFSKEAVDAVELVAGIGVVGDAHAGARVKHRSRVEADPTQPNLRQVHLLHAELFDDVAERGYEIEPGNLGENVTTAGLNLLGLPVGTTLSLGDDAIVVMTGLRNPCGQINGFAQGLLKELVRRDADGTVVRLGGAMSMVVRGGIVRPGDPIRVGLPAEPHHPMVRV